MEKQDEKAQLNANKTIRTPYDGKEDVGTAVESTQYEPIDGGTRGWLMVLGCFFVFFNTWGLVQAFGAFQKYYVFAPLHDYSASTISWIGTVQACFLGFTGLISGPIYDRGYLRLLLIIGSILVVFGMFMLSLATEYYQIFLAQAVCVGIGSGCLYTPGLAQVTVCFTKHRALAIGISTAGAALGGIIYPIVLRELEPRLGFGWTTRVIAFISLGTLLVGVPIVAWRNTEKRSPRSGLDLSALTEVTFVVYLLATFLSFTAYWVPYFFIPIYGQTSAGASESFSFYLLSITNATNLVGRIIPGLIAKWIPKPLHILIISALCSTILIWSWIAIHSVGGLISFCFLFGLSTGPLPVLPASVVRDLSPSVDVVGARMGMLWTSANLGVLIGNPIAGAASNAAQDKFVGGQAYAAASMLGATVLFCVVLWLVGGSHKMESEQHAR